MADIYDYERVHAGVYGPQLLAYVLSRNPDRPAIYVDDGSVLSFRDLRDLTSTYAQALTKLGVGAGTRAGMLSKNRLEVIHSANAAGMVNCCLTPLHPMGSIDDFVYTIEDAQIEALIFDPENFDLIAEKLKARVPRLKHLLAMGPSRAGIDLSALAATFKPGPLVAPEVRGEQVARLNYSGGTTGKPKGIIATHRSSMACVHILLAEWEWPPEDRHLVCAPLSHAGAAVMMPVLVRGGSLVIIRGGFEPVAVMEAIQKYRITSTLLVPTMIYALLDHPRFAEFDLSSLQTVFYGASSISPIRLKEAIERIGPVFFQFYGQAEAPMSVTVMRRSEHDTTDLRRLASCGRPVPWVRTALLDSKGNPVADGEPGEICVRGHLVSNGYWNKPELTAEIFEHGWLHTGDIAICDPDGFWRIVDRKKDMIVTGGFNVYPREVEDVISTHPAVAAVCVIGVPHEKWGETVKAVVVLKPDATVDAETLIALVREKKGSVQAPKSVDFVDSIPMTGLAKADKKALKARYKAVPAS